MTKIRNFFARVEHKRKSRLRSRYVDDKPIDDFERVLKQTEPSAFDVAMDETRKSDAGAWAKLERDLKSEP